MLQLNNINFKKTTVLIADDERSNRKMLMNMLQKVGLEVVEAVDGKDAMIIGEIGTFGVDIKGVGEKFGVDLFKNMGDNLICSANRFDTIEIKTELDRLSNVIDELIRSRESSNG